MSEGIVPAVESEDKINVWMEIAARQMARGVSVKDVADAVGKSVQTLYNARSYNHEFKQLLEKYKAEVVDEVKAREAKFIDDLYSESGRALETLKDVMTKSEDFVCKKCGTVIKQCPDCGEPIKVMMFDRDRVAASRAIIDGLTKTRKEDDGKGNNIPHLVLVTSSRDRDIKVAEVVPDGEK